MAPDVEPAMRARLYSLTLESPDPHRLANFYTRALGFKFTEVARDRLTGRAIDRRLTIIRGAAGSLAEARFLTESPSDLQLLKGRLQSAGTTFSRGALDSGPRSLSFTDPDGNRLLFTDDAAGDAVEATAPHASCTARLQHLVLGSPDIQRLIGFYEDVVGFRISDTVLDDTRAIRTAFLNCSPDHHSVAIFTTGVTRLDHFCFEVGDWGLIRDWCDHFAAERIPLKWGPGRHGPGNNLFVFIHDCDGNWVELSAELEQINLHRPPGTWRHEERTLNSWGHGLLRS